MRKKIIMFLLAMSIIANISFLHNSAAQQPDYEKYGKIATAVVKTDYPGEAVVEYKYIGRNKVNETDVADNFQFEVLEQGKPKKVLVTVTHNLNNKKLISLSVKEQ